MSTLSLLTSREPTRCPQCKYATTWRKHFDNETSECAMCGFVMDRYLMQQSQQAEILTAAIKEKMGHNQALAEWKRMREMYPRTVKPGLDADVYDFSKPQAPPPKPQREVVYAGKPGQKPAQIQDAYFFDINLTRPKPTVTAQGFNPPPLPKPQATIAYSGGPLDGDVAKYVEGGAKRVPLHWPSGAFYALETIDTVLTWVYYGDEDVP